MFCAFVLHLSDPYVAPFPLLNLELFSDFTAFDGRFHLFHTPGFITLTEGEVYSYPPLMAAGQSVFYLFPHPLGTFLTVMVLAFVVVSVLFYRRLRRERIGVRSAAILVVAFLLSYPIWFGFVRANSEFLVWLVLTVGLWAIVRRNSYLAAACFGVAGAMKLYPFIFFALLVSRRQYRQLLFGLAVSAAAYISALGLESGSIAFSWQNRGVGMVALASMTYQAMMFYDHSLFELVKLVMVFVPTVLHRHHYELPLQVAARAELYYLFTFGVMGIVVFFAWIRKAPLLNQIVALALLCVLLPPISFDYTLIELYFPCALLIFAAIQQARLHQGAMLPGLRNALLLMAVVLAPETELSAHHLTVSSLIKWVTLFALFVVSLRQPFSLELDADAAFEGRGEPPQQAPGLAA
jgi:hypothetical protein